jgi:hypothetical protein
MIRVFKGMSTYVVSGCHFPRKSYSLEHVTNGNFYSFCLFLGMENARNFIPNHYVKEKNSRNFIISFQTILQKRKNTGNFVENH